MTCDRDILLLLSCYADGEANPGEAERAEEHLADCPSCRKLVEQWQGQRQLFTWAYTREFTDDEISAAALAQLASKEQEVAMIPEIPQKPARTPLHIPRWGWIGALAAMLLVAFTYYFFVISPAFLKVGQSLIAENHSQATRVGRDIDITLDPHSKIHRVDPHTIRLEQGSIAATVRNKAGIKVITPRMTVTDRGTRFHVGIGTKADYVTVEEGAVDVVAGKTQRTVNAGEALLTDDTGEPTVLVVPPPPPGGERKGVLLRDYHTEFIPCTAVELERYDGVQRLSARFPKVRMDRFFTGGVGRVNRGNRTLDHALNTVEVNGLRQGLRTHLQQIARIFAGRQNDTEEWEIPVALMQFIGVTNPSGLLDDTYYVRIASKGGELHWRFSGSLGNQVDIPLSLEPDLREGHNNTIFDDYLFRGTGTAKYTGSGVQYSTGLQAAIWPEDLRPTLHFYFDGPRESEVMKSTRSMFAEVARQFPITAELELKRDYCEMLYLDLQRKHRLFVAWNQKSGEQLCRVSDQAKRGRGGSAILAVIATDSPLMEPEAKASTYLLRLVMPNSSKKPHLELTTADMRPVAARGASSDTIQIDTPDKEGGNSYGYTAVTSPIYGGVTLSISPMREKQNTFPFQFQVIGRPDDPTTRQIKKGNVTSWRVPTEVWAEGWIRVKKP